MKKLLTAGVFSLLTAASGHAALAQAGPPTVPGRVVLRLKPAFQPAAVNPAQPELPAVAPALRALGATGWRQKFPRSLPPGPERPGGVDLRPIYEVDVPAALPLAKVRSQLLSTGAVEYVEPLYVRRPQMQPNDPLSDSTIAAAAAGQYYLKKIAAYRAWDLQPGDTSLVIGIADGGIRFSHRDLAAQVKYNYADPINGVDDDQDGYVDNFRGWDFANNDNDPGYDPRLAHGNLVAGVAAARVGNALGIAGVGNRCKFLPLSVYATTPTGTFGGFEAIVYAADHGCRVINLSWGGPGGYSRFEQDVCTYAAVNRDAVLVAAAGNGSVEEHYYPASYDGVLSVSASDPADRVDGTFNRRVDLVAPGHDVLTTYGNGAATAYGPVDNDYVPVTGTSFSAPMVAAAAALVRLRFPQFTAAQVRAQLRQTADDVYGLPANAAFVGLFGTGRLNVLRALAQTDRREARVTASQFAPARAATGYAPGDTFRLAATVQNLLQPLSGLTVTLSSSSPYLTVRQGTWAAGNLATLATADNAARPFRLAVQAAGVPLNTKATLRYRLTASGGYQLDEYVDVLLNPDFVQLDAGDLALSLTTRANLAYDRAADASGGLGLSYLTRGPLLSEGGLLVATSPTRVSDRLRGLPGQARQSFYTEQGIRRLPPGPRADQLALSVLRDSLPNPQRPRSVGVRVRQRGLSWAAPAARRNVAVLEYTLTNLTADTLRPLYAGLFADWDLPGESGRNVARWDSTLQLGYVADPLAPRVLAGVQVLRGGTAGVFSLDNNAPAGSLVRLVDGFSPLEKFLTLSNGTVRAYRTAGLPGGADVSQVVSARVARLAPGDSATVAFAVLAAPTLAQLQAAAAAAPLAYAQTLAAAPAGARAAWQLYPNPTAGPLRLELPNGFAATQLQVLDALGRVRRAQVLPSGAVKIDLNLIGLPAGVYTVRVLGPAGVATRPVVLQ